LGIKYQGKIATADDVEFIKSFIAGNLHNRIAYNPFGGKCENGIYPGNATR